MEINNPAATTPVETLSRPEAVNQSPEPRQTETEQTGNRPEPQEAFQVDLSAEARTRQAADEAALEQTQQQQQQLAATYNSLGEIAG